jgi:hypothetical protein
MSIYKKLLEVQKEVGAISKDSKNPFFKSKYFDINQLIEHVQPVLNDKGLLLTQPIRDNVVYSVINEVDSNDFVQSSLILPELNDPQKIGSCITYYRRYTLASLLGLQAEDDDANLASKKTYKPVKKLEMTAEIYQKSVDAVKDGKATIEQIKAKYDLSETREKALKELIKL